MTTREQFLTKFAAWLLEAGHADSQLRADRLAWDFVVPAWDGDDDMDEWQAAWLEANPQSQLAAATNLNELFRLMKKHGDNQEIDWTELPTFGGDDIRHAVLIWSWDESRKIVGSCADDLAIVEREDLDAT